jgi:hypothetical protein
MNRDGLSRTEKNRLCTPLIRHLRASTLTHCVRLSAKLRLVANTLVFPVFSLRHPNGPRSAGRFSVFTTRKRMHETRQKEMCDFVQPVCQSLRFVSYKPRQLALRNHTPPESREKTNIIGFPLKYTKYYRPSFLPKGRQHFSFRPRRPSDA